MCSLIFSVLLYFSKAFVNTKGLGGYGKSAIQTRVDPAVKRNAGLY
jgi:hypothetical protein